MQRQMTHTQMTFHISFVTVLMHNVHCKCWESFKLLLVDFVTFGHTRQKISLRSKFMLPVASYLLCSYSIRVLSILSSDSQR